MPHIHEKIDFTVDAVIVFENKVLLRKHDKYKKWLFPGGHIELNEDPNQAALREVKEEVGLDVELFNASPFFKKSNEFYGDLIPPLFVNRHRINANHEHVSFIYVASSKSNKIVQSVDELSEECRWFTYEELQDSALVLDSTIKPYAETALRLVGRK